MSADLVAPLIWLCVFVYGLVLGSFTTCVVYRVPRKISLWRHETGPQSQRSFCTACRHPLSARDLVPLFSWLAQRGRCRYCATGIDISYPVIEAGVAVAVIMLVLIFGTSLLAFALSALIPCLAGFGAWAAARREAA